MTLATSEALEAVELQTPYSLSTDATRAIFGLLRALAVGIFVLYRKMKSFRWHVSGAHFHSRHLMLDKQSEQVFATIERARDPTRP